MDKLDSLLVLWGWAGLAINQDVRDLDSLEGLCHWWWTRSSWISESLDISETLMKTVASHLQKTYKMQAYNSGVFLRIWNSALDPWLGSQEWLKSEIMWRWRPIRIPGACRYVSELRKMINLIKLSLLRCLKTPGPSLQRWTRAHPKAWEPLTDSPDSMYFKEKISSTALLQKRRKILFFLNYFMWSQV